ncbi:MAG: hypothetical protein PHC88_01125 [Terrimicrobiaceae bacterium]|nr:hypothetical protein [Terrimicrobiaceae bacterium]
MKFRALSAFCALFLPHLYGSEIVYFYALDADLSAFKAQVDAVVPSKNVLGSTVTTMKLGGHHIYALKMGSGCMQTAVAAAIVLSRFPCDLAISTGPAGRLSNQLSVGECVRIADVVEYQKGSQSQAGFVLGKDASTVLSPEFPIPEATPQMLKDCRSIRLASGELFIASNVFRERLRETTKAQAVDMNLGGLVNVCAKVGVPLLAWKVVSDSADNSASTDFQEFVKRYRGEAGTMAAKLIKLLPKNPNDPENHSNLKSLLDSVETSTWGK